MSLQRYARQMVLPEIGSEGQGWLSRSHVVVVGAGGLGCAALPYLVGGGLGRVTVVDKDKVEVTNLHRQTLYREADVGLPKAEVAAKHLRALNSECEIIARSERFEPSPWLLEADVVLDCADSFAVSYLASDFCASASIPYVSASAVGLHGYVGGFCGGAPSLRAVFPELPERAGSCASMGVLGPIVGTLGCLQAQMSLAILLKLQPSPLGRLITFDARTFQLGGFRFDDAPEPEGSILRFINSAAIQPDDFVVDLRSRDEAPEPVTPSAERLRVDDFGPGHPTPTPGARAVLCCATGLRAWRAARRLQEGWAGDIVLVALG